MSINHEANSPSKKSTKLLISILILLIIIIIGGGIYFWVKKNNTEKHIIAYMQERGLLYDNLSIGWTGSFSLDTIRAQDSQFYDLSIAKIEGKAKVNGTADLAIQNIVVTYPSLSLKVETPHIDIANYRPGDMDLKARYNMDMSALDQFLLKDNADKITIPQSTYSIQYNLSPLDDAQVNIALILKDTVFNNLQNGQIATYHYANGTMTATIEGDFDNKIESPLNYNFQFNQLEGELFDSLHLYDWLLLNGDENSEAKPILGPSTLADMSTEMRLADEHSIAKQSGLKANSIVLKRSEISPRQIFLNLAPVIEAGFSNEAWEDYFSDRQNITLSWEAFKALSNSLVSMDFYAEKSSQEMETPEVALRVAYSDHYYKIDHGRYSAGAQNIEMEISGDELAEVAETALFKMDSIELQNLRFPALFTEGDKLIERYLSPNANRWDSSYFDMYQDMNSFINMFMLHIDKFQIQNMSLEARQEEQDGWTHIFLMKNLNLEPRYQNTLLPTALKFQLQNLSFPNPEAGHPRSNAMALIPDQIDISAGIDLIWDEQTRRIAVNDLSFSMPGFGSFAIEGHISNAAKNIFEGNWIVASMSLLGVGFQDAVVTMQDDGLINILREVSRENGYKAAQKQWDEIQTEIDHYATYITQDGDQKHQLMQAINAFLYNYAPLKFSLEAKNNTGIQLFDFIMLQENPDTIRERLEFKLLQ